MALTRRRFLQGLAGATLGGSRSAAWGARSGNGKSGKPRNVVFICLDTARADHLGCYGYRRPASPHLDQLARRSMVFDDVLSPSSWTLPVLASVMTGVYPHEHGALHFRTPIRNGVVRLPELLREAGMVTAAMGQFPFHFDFYRFQAGFDLYAQQWSQVAYKSTEDILEWLRRQAGGDHGFFLWAHYFEPHVPYEIQIDSIGFYDPSYRGKTCRVHDATLTLKLAAEKTPQADAERRRIVDLYDGEIRCADKYLGRILGQLDWLGVLDSTMVIVTADHGEHFGEHGLVEHGNSLYEELVRVPLVIHAPGGQTGRCRQLVSLIDLFPTILDFLGLPAHQVSGGSLMPALQGRPLPNRTLFSTLDTATSVIFVPNGRDPSRIEAKDTVIENRKLVRHGRQKLLYDVKNQTYELYDLAADPHEQRNLLSDGAPPAGLRKQLDDWLLAMERHRPTVAAPDRSVIEAMRSLGYIQ